MEGQCMILGVARSMEGWPKREFGGGGGVH